MDKPPPQPTRVSQAETRDKLQDAVNHDLESEKQIRFVLEKYGDELSAEQRSNYRRALDEVVAERVALSDFLGANVQLSEPGVPVILSTAPASAAANPQAPSFKAEIVPIMTLPLPVVQLVPAAVPALQAGATQSALVPPINPSQFAGVETMLLALRKLAITRPEAFFQEGWMKAELVTALLDAGYTVVEGTNDSCEVISKDEQSGQLQVIQRPRLLISVPRQEGTRDIKFLVGANAHFYTVRVELKTYSEFGTSTRTAPKKDEAQADLAHVIEGHAEVAIFGCSLDAYTSLRRNAFPNLPEHVLHSHFVSYPLGNRLVLRICRIHPPFGVQRIIFAFMLLP